MATITLKGNAIQTKGDLPAKGTKAPDFELVKPDLSKATLNDFAGSCLVLNIFPCLDTDPCSASVRRFNKEAADLKNTKVLCISRDLPFTQARFCGAEGITNVVTLSDYATHQFGKDYNVEITTGPMAHFLSRAVIVLDENHKVIYTQQIPEILEEPNYEDALAVLK